jgi:1L-myo-inositol 1-phosphate cytidylyltransferase / CDP-L-myo-inositol myo-inositolphosphotransferase
MNQSTNTLRNISVLHLPSPPKPCKTSEWYTSPIAGVPFLLRNVLSLQRSGIHDLIVYIDNEEIEKLASIIKDDSRITIKIHWASNSEQLKEALQNRESQILLFNGSALHDKKEIRSLLKTFTQQETALPLTENQLESLIEKNQRNDEKELKKFREQTPSFTYIPGSATARIQEQKDFRFQHERLLAGSGQNHDSLITRILSRSVSQKMTRLLLNTPVTPNQITLFSVVMGIVSAICFALGTYPLNVFGGFSLLFSTWLDGTDGEIARLKFMESELGGKLDIICDNIVHFFVFGAIGWGLATTTGDETYLYLGGLAAFASLASFMLFGGAIFKKNSGAISPVPDSEPSLAEKLANRDFINFLMLMALIDQIKIFIIIAAIGATVFTIYLVYLRLTQESK